LSLTPISSDSDILDIIFLRLRLIGLY